MTRHNLDFVLDDASEISVLGAEMELSVWKIVSDSYDGMKQRTDDEEFREHWIDLNIYDGEELIDIYYLTLHTSWKNTGSYYQYFGYDYQIMAENSNIDIEEDAGEHASESFRNNSKVLRPIFREIEIDLRKELE